MCQMTLDGFCGHRVCIIPSHVGHSVCLCVWGGGAKWRYPGWVRGLMVVGAWEAWNMYLSEEGDRAFISHIIYTSTNMLNADT